MILIKFHGTVFSPSTVGRRRDQVDKRCWSLTVGSVVVW
ncbi:MAG: hypothetical protein RLZZ511_2870 [Cyanobacteriota bacterium]